MTKDINDLEKNKFALDDWYISVDVISASQWYDDIWNKDINDLEKEKFESDGTIRIVTAI